jgi:hypothetical protein
MKLLNEGCKTVEKRSKGTSLVKNVGLLHKTKTVPDKQLLPQGMLVIECPSETRKRERDRERQCL